ncbi:MAG: hypothetical protein KIT84_41745 [Labilithrix sp.]|nr:hypothetical protein [Labilithrix sp.]MCW5817597.1 hypothetical protein [Labilithrix sp.]
MLRSIACLALPLLMLAGCTVNADDTSAASEQHATSAEDVEVARLRTAFRQGASPLPRTADRSALAKALGFGSRSPDGLRRVWTCARRAAGRGDEPGATTVHYSFQPGAADDEATNEADGFGASFVRDPQVPSELIGYRAGHTPGAIQTFQTVRVDGDDLVMEETLRLGVGASTYEQERWNKARNTYESALSGSGLALAYTRCTNPAGHQNGAPVVFYDDFSDASFTRQSWGDNVRLEGAMLEPWTDARLTVSAPFSTFHVTYGHTPSRGTFYIGDLQIRHINSKLLINGTLSSFAIDNGEEVTFELLEDEVRITKGDESMSIPSGQGHVVPAGSVVHLLPEGFSIDRIRIDAL